MEQITGKENIYNTGCSSKFLSEGSDSVTATETAMHGRDVTAGGG
jgi:hypothetical protein